MPQAIANVPRELREIYESYTQALARAWAAAPKTARLFGMGEDPRKHPCNNQFYENTGQWAEAFARSGPEPEAAEAAVDWILFAAARHRQEDPYWYFYAAQKHAGYLIPLLSPEAAAEIRLRFAEMYPRADWAPVQKEIYSLLTKQARVSEEKRHSPLCVWKGLFHTPK